MSNENGTNLSQTAGNILLQTAASAYSIPAKVAIGLSASSVMVMIIVGNILVCIAVVTERKLRHPQNWFLVSLAASDLLVGTLIMPFALAYELMGYWAFGPVWCEIWLAMDVFACTASIFNLCLIALERYRCVVNPTAYSSPTINRRQGILIAGAYITAAAISLPPLFGWAEPRAQDGALPECPLHQSLGYVAFSATASFYIPLIVMVTAYICLIVATRAHLRKKLTNCPPATPIASRSRTPMTTPKIRKEKKDGHVTNDVNHLKPPTSIRLQVLSFDSGMGSHSAAGSISQASPCSKPKNGAGKNGEPFKAAAISGTTEKNQGGKEKNGGCQCGQDGADISKENGTEKELKTAAQQLNVAPRCAIETEDSSLQAQAQSTDCIKVLQRVGTRLEMQFDRNRKDEPSPGGERLKILQSRERRFTLIIGLVMGAFIVCWYPFFQLYPIVIACESCKVPEVVFKFFFWIGYCNSAANPIIYTIFNKDFRGAFLRIITCGVRNNRTHGANGR
ncbi:alpha-2 adrenergic receptor-like [Branchiostoma floridae]|uniref:Alpha-2 adrenergic receptor-like n=1 Tax=Branchiostoma floridae TaxID=7739 RepID=A0A9J7KFY8_BRAFL|nr:alpha-2 adrenergic receptor-like [Branchiostoma floridae]